MIKYKFPLGYVKIVKIDGESPDQIVEFVSCIIKSLNTYSVNNTSTSSLGTKGAELKNVFDFISENNRKALEWQIWFIA